jgi:cytochrome P450
VSSLVAAAQRGDVASEPELFANCALLLGAGHQTTTNLIGNAVLALLHNPDQRRRLVEDRMLIRTAIEEFLRYDSPVQVTARVAADDYPLDGKTIARGDFVVVLLGAANRDPAEFDEPDRLDLGRQTNRHVAFSAGVHSCLGAMLARIEAQIVITTLLRRFPRLRAEDEIPDWKPMVVSRGLNTLRVTF